MSPDDLLVERGAVGLEHPGGTLHAHLHRVSDLLAEWGADDDLRLLGLCHALYGTDGFPVALVDVETERDLVRGIVGEGVEAAIFLYDSCDRRHLYPQAGQETVDFLDRWSGQHAEMKSLQLKDFWELSFANELDICRQSDDLRAHLGPLLWQQWAPARPWVSDAAWATFEATVAPVEG